MQPTFRERINYKFERFLSKGGSSIFLSLTLVFISGFILIVGLRFILISLFPELSYFDSFLDDIWVVFLQMTDPGNMSQDDDAPFWLKTTTIVAGLVGVILLSMLIAFITTTLESVFFEFRRGRGRVLEKNHTLILGWNERVVDVIRELIMANESEKSSSIVVLAKEDKESMDNLIKKRLPNTKNTQIITTKGDYANINELRRVGITEAKSVALLANCSESAHESEKSNSDVQSIKAIMAIISCQDGHNTKPIIAEIFNKEKRDLIAYFNDKNIIALDSWNIMGKLLVQTSLTSGLEIVYSEILSFDGCEVYFYEEEDWKNIDFYDLPFYFKDGIPIGIYNSNSGLTLRPDHGTKMNNGDKILILASDDSEIRFESSQFVFPKDLPLADGRIAQENKHILILGWHNVAKIFIHEAGAYLLDGSVFDIMFSNPPDSLKAIVNELQQKYTNFKINLIDKNPLLLKNLENINPFDYNNIIVLSQDLKEQNVDKIDADTLLILLLLRTIKKGHLGQNTKIITQVLNSENQEIITQTDVDDFIISNRLITMILSQLSENPMIKLFYDDIFSEEGSEIYVKPAYLYFNEFPQKINFSDVMGVANKRNEICLGIRKTKLRKKANSNFGISLNLPKDEMLHLEADDFFVVLSEDEL
ncbi:MAG: hypothetical protein MK207_08610 [Saprospiraceae bacterium]|nr:hypothetical protein [Saprospiraceae bacterium]